MIIQRAEREGELKPIEFEDEVEVDLELMEFVSQVRLIQRYTNEITDFTNRMEQLREEISLAIGQQEKGKIYNFNNAFE